jgi:hypothetical protein
MTKTMTVRSGVKAGGINFQHAEAVAVKSAVKAGGISLNHAEA